ncbi:TonB-dependent receptor [Sphingobacteriaceae bacterium]|nr:TonB-dependent receptor [Sphingobacteriaceae bacterium]
MTKIYLTLCLNFILILGARSQINGVIRGNVKDKNTQEYIIGASIFIEGTTTGVSSDIDGNYKLTVPVGTYRLKASFVGYSTILKENIVVTSGNAQIINFEMEPSSSELSEVEVTFDKGKSAVATDMITPLSVQQLTTEEIKSNPGGNYDVSKVIQTLPGVGGSAGGAARNDIIIRGGAPNENVYYLDGVEIPVLNHFQTQGSSGGATGILNVSFIEDVKLSSSAFDAKYDNALASTFIIKQREGNPEKLSGNLRIAGTEAAATLEGPLGKKTNFLASARRSYLQYLFELIDLPIRPNFWDFQYKVTHKFNDKTTLTAIGIGGIDEFAFATPKNSSPENIYITRSLPYINQWNYTTGFSLKRLIDKGFMNFTVSRNMFNNALDKFEDDKQLEDKRTFKLRSQEIENKFRWDINKYVNGWKISGGVMAQYVKYNTKLFSQVTNALSDSLGNEIAPATKITFNSAIEFFKYGAFATVAKNILNQKLLVSFGLRTDMNSFIIDGNNPLNTLSPRLSLAYHVSSKFDITGSIGSYYKIPTYTTLGYRDANNVLVNKSMKYIQSNHYVIGTQFLPNESLRFTVEGFYKQYASYPVSAANGISLANQGADFGSIGSEKINSNGKGECYGFEFFVQQKLVKKIFYVFSYTFVRSTFSGSDNKLIVSSWDNQHLISATLGYKFKKNWQLGLKYRLSGGLPYTPFDLTASQQNYLLLGTGVLDYSKLNSKRLDLFNQLDLRVDKKFNFKRTSLDLFVDVQNILLFRQQSAPNYTFKRNADNTGFETTDGNPVKNDGSNAIPVILQNDDLSATPTIGIIFEF